MLSCQINTIHYSLRVGTILVCALMVAIVTLSGATKAACPPGASIAVSLKALQDSLEKCAPSNHCSDDLLLMGGMTELTGYVLDRENRDLILIGRCLPDLPPLHLEDFVVALRNAWLKYAPLEGNTYIYSYPGCSIDPDVAVMNRLNQISQRMNSKPGIDAMDGVLEDWRRECGNPQAVRVLGIPFDCRFASVMVTADYDMKTLVDGSDSLDLPGFTSTVDAALAQLRRAVITGGAMPGLASYNRFWFYPGSIRFEAQGNVVLISQSPVKLLTEAMHSGGGAMDPLAESFADQFSILYDEVAARRPIYQELEGLFRFVAIAKAMRFRSEQDDLPVDLGYLLEGFRIPKLPVDRSLPGRSAVRTFTHSQTTDRGVATTYLWLPSCGGVGVDIDVTPESFDPAMSADIDRYPQAIERARPSPSTPSWSYTVPW
ncbi:MAG: DUF1598 domain-containing protein, partial [candidate division Zixibacteria bacterium]|nr:DUF1598 domain-containing protein [candidate division Zixibacteria bacterium]